MKFVSDDEASVVPLASLVALGWRDWTGSESKQVSVMTMKLGYILASHEVAILGKAVGYLYREAPDNENDSGWRVFSGDESREYADDASNFSMYNASTIVELDPSIQSLLGHRYPVAFERDPETGGVLV